jgi:branched-chain amino acid transport system permease protein
VGAYVGYSTTQFVGFWAALVLAAAVTALLGALTEIFLLRPVHRFGQVQELLVTFGVAICITEVIKLVFGDAPVNYGIPKLLDFAAFRLFDVNYPFYRLFIGAVALGMFGALHLLLTRTRVGLIVRAALFRPRTVECLGHNIPVVFTGVFSVGAGLAGLAGAVAGAFYTVSPSMGLELGVLVFVVVVVGGLGSLKGAMLGSLIIGVTTSVAATSQVSISSVLAMFGIAVEAGTGLLNLQLSSVAATVPFILMLLVLLVRPGGLKGSAE